MAQGHVFDDDAVKEEMLRLRLKGMSYKDLGKKYGVDHTSILHHCQVAGITLSEGKRKAMFVMLKNRASYAQITKALGIPSTVINYYCLRKGRQGNKRYYTKQITRPEPIKAVKAVRVQRTPILRRVAKIPEVLPPKTVLTKTDSRGVEWRLGEEGDWICIGKTAQQYKEDKINDKRRALEAKRLQMLTY